MDNSKSTTMSGQLDALIQKWHLLGHPFYQAWTAGRLSREALQLYAAQYYRHVKAFPEHLRALATRTEGELRGLIEENLAEEESPGRTHPQLWRDFAAAVGADEAALDESPARPGVESLVETYDRLCREGAPVEAVAALYAYEAQVPEIATQKIEGLRKFYGVTDARGLAYFAVHEEADVRHRAVWRRWLEAQPVETQERALAAAEQGLRALWGALDAVTPESCSGLRPAQPPSAER
jgi:pyrroloquinoline-quinone synthase